MSLDLKTQMHEWTDESLLESCYHMRDDYTPDAIRIMEEEIARRGIPDDTISAYRDVSESAVREADDLFAEDFIPLPHDFSRTDILLVSSLLKEASIPLIVDDPASGVLPLETESARVFTVRVPKHLFDQAEALINEQFYVADGVYKVKYADLKDRLKAVNFYEIHLSEKERDEVVDVSFSDREVAAIVAYAKKLREQIDVIEQNVVVFHFDNIDHLVEELERPSGRTLRKEDLQTILELFQIYCDDETFPVYLNESIGSLLDFFIG